MSENPQLAGGVGPDGPGYDLVPVAGDDNTDLTVPARSIRCSPGGAAGTLRFTAHTGEVRNTSIALGETLPVVALRIHATGTTATGLEIYI